MPVKETWEETLEREFGRCVIYREDDNNMLLAIFIIVALIVMPISIVEHYFFVGLEGVGVAGFVFWVIHLSFKKSCYFICEKQFGFKNLFSLSTYRFDDLISAKVGLTRFGRVIHFEFKNESESIAVSDLSAGDWWLDLSSKLIQHGVLVIK